MHNHPSTEELPEGILSVPTVRYGTDLTEHLFDSVEEATAHREEVTEYLRVSRKIETLNALLEPGPKEEGEYVQQHSGAVRRFRREVNALLATISGTSCDLAEIATSLSVKRDPVMMVRIIGHFESQLAVLALFESYVRLAHIDKNNREWMSPSEAGYLSW